PSCPRRNAVRRRGEWDPRMARPARSDLHRRLRSDRRARARARGAAVTRAPHGADVAVAAQLACLLEASAPKPGNVSPGADFHDARYEDFLASAAGIGPAVAAAAERPRRATTPAALAATRPPGP